MIKKEEEKGLQVVQASELPRAPRSALAPTAPTAPTAVYTGSSTSTVSLDP